MKKTLLCTALLAIAAALALSLPALLACPFCSAVSMTLGEELKSSDAAVIATLLDSPASSDPASGAPTKSRFQIVKALKGESLLKGKPTIEMLYFGTQEPGAKFLLFGVDPKEMAWGTPTALTEEGIAYIDSVAKLNDAAPERLKFFQEYFENADPLLAGDAFNEFAKAPYADVQSIKNDMHRNKLVGWIRDDKIPASRRRLYLTMLGMCGQPEDVALIEGMIKTDDRQVRSALDAMIGCYLSLRGVEGLPLVEELFLKNDKSEYVDTYSAIVALRVLGQETNLIPKERLVEALELMLDRPQLADLVIPDLARWQDWKAMPKLVDLFKNANEESSWVRVPVVQFLRACPDPKAEEYLKELAAIDPDAVKRATNYLALPGAGAPPPAAAATAPAADAPPAAAAEKPADKPATDTVAPAGEAPAAPAITDATRAAPEAKPAADADAVAAPAASSEVSLSKSGDSVVTEPAAKSPAADKSAASKSDLPVADAPEPLSTKPDPAMWVLVGVVLLAGTVFLLRRH